MAALHKASLDEQVALHAHDPRLRWFHAAYVQLTRELSKDTWNDLEMVSVVRRPRYETTPFRQAADSVELLGYVDASFSRASNSVNSLSFVRWAPQPSLEWARDMARFLRLLFVQYGQHSVSWNVVVGSPHERSYDNLVRRLRGRVVGTFTGTGVLMDGARHDRKYYELTAAQLDRETLDRMAGIRRSANGRSAGGNGEARPGEGDARAGDQGAGAPGGQGAGVGGGDVRPGHGGADGAVGEPGGGDAGAAVVSPGAPLLSGVRTWPNPEGVVPALTMDEYLERLLEQQRRAGR